MSVTATQGSGGTAATPTTSELCISLFEEFAKGNIAKTEAMHQILEAFRESSAHENASSAQVQSVITAYISMLEQAKSS